MRQLCANPLTPPRRAGAALRSPPLRAAAYVSATGSAGTIAAGDFLKTQFPGLKIVATEALQCPTLLLNGFGDHRIEGIGDKHVPWVHNVRNTDAVAAIDDKDCLRVLRLFNEPAGQDYLATLGAERQQIEQLPCLGISSICNLLAAIKTAKYFEFDERDVIVTVFTDSTDLYQSRLAELRAERGAYTTTQAAKDHAGPLAHQRCDAFKELTYPERKAIHNLKDYTWVEQQGKTAAELDGAMGPRILAQPLRRRGRLFRPTHRGVQPASRHGLNRTTRDWRKLNRGLKRGPERRIHSASNSPSSPTPRSCPARGEFPGRLSRMNSALRPCSAETLRRQELYACAPAGIVPKTRAMQNPPFSCSLAPRRLSVAAAAALLLGGCTQRTHSARPAPQALPKVRIAKDGRTFETGRGQPFAPCGVTYYRPGTGWAPQVWKQFDAEATRRDFARLKAMGLNCVRVFLSYGSFYREPGVLEPEGLARFDQFLRLAEEAGLYVHPTGPDLWEGAPNWQPVSVEDDRTVQALEQFWKLFAARYRGRNVIFAYDLKNEPEVGWKNETLTVKWASWLRRKYQDEEALSRAWGLTNRVEFGNAPVPGDANALNRPQLLDYQTFREDLADEWTRRQVAAIKAADPNALVTAGLIQWSVPALLPAGPRHYSAFNPQRQARLLDFLDIHFYPLEGGALQYRSEAEEVANLAYLESVLRETARPGKPVVLAEFGWYGGGKLSQYNWPAASEAQQAHFCRRMLETSAGWVAGWLNWGFHDHPGANDCSELTGLLTADGRTKEWGSTFQQWALDHAGRRIPPPKIGPRPDLDWPACVTSRQAGNQFRKAYLRAFQAEH